jgi:hypothetical protein
MIIAGDGLSTLVSFIDENYEENMEIIMIAIDAFISIFQVK